MTFRDIIKQELNKDYMKNLMDFLKHEMQTKTIFPKKEEWFLSMEITELNDVKVVMLGQDPYHDYNQAHGLAFSVLNNRLPKSLINMFIELKTDININRTNGNLSDWAKQGVLLLNTILTVEAHKPLSHQNRGWERFTLEIIKKINEENRPIVFVLMGKNAQSYKPFLTNIKHLIIETPHPSPLSAYRGFFNSKIYSRINHFLESNDLRPIKW